MYKLFVPLVRNSHPMPQNAFSSVIFAHKAYREYDLTTNKIFIFQDVTFDENVFPFQIIPLLEMHLLSLIPYSIFFRLLLIYLALIL